MDKVEEYPSSPGEKERREQEARTWIERSSDIPEELKHEILKKVHIFVEPERYRPERSFGHSGPVFQMGQLGWTRWAVRDDQLNLLGALTPAALAVVTYATAVAGSPYVLAAALLFAALNIASKLKRKGVILEPEYYRVLIALKEIGPSSIEQLVSALNGLHIAGPPPFTESRVLEILNGLKKIRANDGTLETLAVEAADGTWSTNGV